MKYLRGIIGLCIAAVLILPVPASATKKAVVSIQFVNNTGYCVRFEITNERHGKTNDYDLRGELRSVQTFPASLTPSTSCCLPVAAAMITSTKFRTQSDSAEAMPTRK